MWSRQEVVPGAVRQQVPSERQCKNDSIMNPLLTDSGSRSLSEDGVDVLDTYYLGYGKAKQSKAQHKIPLQRGLTFLAHTAYIYIYELKR